MNMIFGVGDAVRVVCGEYEGMVGTITHINTDGWCELYCVFNNGDGYRFIDTWDLNLEPLHHDAKKAGEALRRIINIAQSGKETPSFPDLEDVMKKIMNEVSEVKEPKAKFQIGDLVVPFNKLDKKYIVVSAEWTADNPEWRYTCNWYGTHTIHSEVFLESELVKYDEVEENPNKVKQAGKPPYQVSVETLIDRQIKKGIDKYGVTLDQNTTLTAQQRVEHLEEELIDGLMYCEHWKSVAGKDGISANDYQRAALRTAQVDSMSMDELLLNGVMGLCGEAGEVIDLVKKTRFQGHGMDYDALKKELGDVAWYLAIASHGAGYTLSSIMERNIEKLKERYPEGFDKSRSIHRKENTSEENGPGFAD